MQDGAVQTERSLAGLRRAMVDNQIRTFDVTDQRVLESFYRVPRERFVPAELQDLVYSDAPIALPAPNGGEPRVQMPPMFLAKLLQNAGLKPSTRALIVAGATGYPAAILSPLVASIVSLDSEAAYSATATSALAGGGIANVRVMTGPLADGAPADAPFDLVLVNGAVEQHLEALLKQVAPGGCLVAISTGIRSASRRSGKAVRYDNVSGEFSVRILFDATLPVLPAFREAPTFVF